MEIPAPRSSGHVLLTSSAVLIAALLGGCATSPFSSGTSLAEAKAAYHRQDYGTAAQLLESLAYEGHPEAQYALGYMYYYGRGVRQNRKWAVSWFGEAARLGHPKAGQALASLRSEARLTRRPDVAGSTRIAHAQSRSDQSPHRQRVPAAGNSVPGRQEFAGRSQRQAKLIRSHGRQRVAGEPRQRPGLPRVETEKPDERKQAVAGSPGRVDTKRLAVMSAPGSVSPEAAVQPEVVTEPTRTGTGVPRIAEAAKPDTPSEASGANSHEPATPDRSERPGPSEGKGRGEGQLLSAGRPRFTLQLIGSRSKQDLVQLVERFELEDVRYFQGEHKGGPWYRLLYRGFDSLVEARRALKRLPPELERHKPWVRNFPPVRLAALKRFD